MGRLEPSKGAAPRNFRCRTGAANRRAEGAAPPRFSLRENEVPHTSWHVAENKVPQGAAAPPKGRRPWTPATQLSLPFTFLGTAG